MWRKHQSSRDRKHCCHMFYIPDEASLWGNFAQEDHHYIAKGVGIIAAILLLTTT